MDALAPSAEEGRGTLRKASGSRVQALIRGCPNGETRCCETTASQIEYIDLRREPGELKHLSTQRKRDHSLSSGERKGSSLNHRSMLLWGCRARQMRVTKREVSRMVWDSLPKRVIAPYAKTERLSLGT